MNIIQMLSQEFSIQEKYIQNIVNLIDEKNTIPFIARYRKELTNSCDDQVLRDIFDRLTYLRNLEERKQEIINSITEQEKMTDEILKDIEAATTLARLEDIYRPFKQKKKTRASMAKEKGLTPLYERMIAQEDKTGDVLEIAKEFVTESVETPEDALQGAMDILAEDVSDNPACRDKIRKIYNKSGLISTVAKEEDAESVYQMYYEYSEPVHKIPSHRILAINRGEKEDMLKVSVVIDEESCLKVLEDEYLKYECIWTSYVKDAIADAYKRLIHPSLEREVRSLLTDMASEQAIKIFGLNLKALLMQPPIKGKVVLAVDPAYRTGCKIAVCDQTGKVLDTTVIYPTPPQNKIAEAKITLKKLIEKHQVEIISIGNGTASKESELFIAELISEIERPLSYMVVSEAGASVYSASKLGAQEFPEFDVSLRSAVSIGRRLQDPLSELVKIDPKAIGVGQYQHDMPQKRLSEALLGVVEDCVNKVGVDLNTASPSLLEYVAGLSASVAGNIVKYREENGAFNSRSQLLKVPKLGPKAYTQCAGFLRIPDGKNVLDNTGVHPETYDACKEILSRFSYDLTDVAKGNMGELSVKIDGYVAKTLAEELNIGLPTLKDIVKELAKPGRDIRDELPPPLLRKDILDIKDLKEGMEVTGTVRNVVDFGAFIDLGVHHDGLVHISQISDKFIRHPSEMLSVGQVVTATVLSVDLSKNRIALTLKKKPQ
ncbi:MAG: RNA-binding transcriptional accessory protein [Ruminococcaceae bacterium]|nr:RNA-binding transcriptional accessory protein [Oscillospiraceae bacterium]